MFQYGELPYILDQVLLTINLKLKLILTYVKISFYFIIESIIIAEYFFIYTIKELQD